MVIVEARIDSRPKDLLEQVTCIVECVGMDTVGKRQAIDHDVYLSCPEVVPDQAGRCSRNTSVCRRIFRMVGRYPQWCPVRVCDQIRIPPASRNGGYWTPEVVGKLGVPAADRGIRDAGPKK